MATSVTKTMLTETAHRLQHHPGACRNLHGHTYKWEVTVETDELNDQGMVFDFKDLKKLMENYIDAPFDHATVLEIDDPLVALLSKTKTKLKLMKCAPTAENFAKIVYYQIKHHLGDLVKSVTVWETPSSYAIFSED